MLGFVEHRVPRRQIPAWLLCAWLVCAWLLCAWLVCAWLLCAWLVCGIRLPEFLASLLLSKRAFFFGFFASAGFVVPASFEAQNAPVGCSS